LEDVGRVKLISTLWGWDVYAIPESIFLMMKGDYSLWSVIEAPLIPKCKMVFWSSHHHHWNSNTFLGGIEVPISSYHYLRTGVCPKMMVYDGI
jgi:hypothetical protein